MGPIRCPETSVKDYYSTLRNIPEGCRSYLRSLHLIIFYLRLKNMVLIDSETYRNIIKLQDIQPKTPAYCLLGDDLGFGLEAS
jgi:hypothetical protein